MECRAAFACGCAFVFGPFRLFPSQRLLLEGDRNIRIGGRALDILTLLVDRAGEVVGTDELIKRVWPNVIVEDSNLTTQVCMLRRILGAGRRFIVTITGRGYSFVAPVCVVHGPACGAENGCSVRERILSWPPDAYCAVQAEPGSRPPALPS